MGRQHQGMDKSGVWQVLEGSGEQGKMEKTGCKIICGAPTALAVKGLMMMMKPKSEKPTDVSTTLFFLLIVLEYAPVPTFVHTTPTN